VWRFTPTRGHQFWGFPPTLDAPALKYNDISRLARPLH
jgi:hypothetical protein